MVSYIDDDDSSSKQQDKAMKKLGYAIEVRGCNALGLTREVNDKVLVNLASSTRYEQLIQIMIGLKPDWDSWDGDYEFDHYDTAIFRREEDAALMASDLRWSNQTTSIVRKYYYENDERVVC